MVKLNKFTHNSLKSVKVTNHATKKLVLLQEHLAQTRTIKSSMTSIVTQ